MKKLNLFFAGFALIMAHNLLAQRPIEVTADSFDLSQKTYQGILVIIPETPYDKAKEAWIKKLEKGTKSNVPDDASGEVSIFGTFLKNVSDDPVNIYSKLVPSDSALRMYVSVEAKRDFFITQETSESQFNRLKSFLFEFAQNQYTTVVQEQLKAQSEMLDDRKDELKDLQNEKESLEKRIAQKEHDIVVANDALKQLNSDLTLQNNDLTNTKVTLSTAKGEELRKTIEDRINDIEKDKKKTMNSIEKEKKNIAEYESDISNAKSEMDVNKGKQKIKTGEVELKQEAYDRISNKLKTIESWKFE